MKIDIPQTIEEWNSRGAGYLPGHLRFEFLKVEPDEVCAHLKVETSHLAWNGFMHAGAVVSLADSCCGYGTVRSLPEGADGFTTVDLSCNFIGTALDGDVTCTATPVHKGRRTQVWDATVSNGENGRAIAKFRCTQIILWPR